MPKPYAHWDPSTNATLYVKQGAPPLVVDADSNPEMLEQIVSKSCRLDMFNEIAIDYVQTMRTVDGVSPKSGARIRSFQYMPYGMSFYTYGGASGEPLPTTLSDTTPLPYSLNDPYFKFGYRMSLRGFLGSKKSTGWAADLKVLWADRDTRNISDSRGGYTGAILRSFNSFPGFAYATYDSFGAVHGKRTADTNWSYHPFSAKVSSVTPGPPAALNSIDSDECRIVMGGGQNNNIVWQRWNGSSWVDLYTATIDLGSVAPPQIHDHFTIVADLFAGNILVSSAVPSVWPDAETWFHRIETPHFEPFVNDKSSWSYRGWSDHWSWLSPGSEFLIERRLPSRDLMHVPPGVVGGPANLRTSDSDLGICVEFNDRTYLFTIANNDNAGIAPTLYDHASVMDEAAYGYQAPFAMVGRFKFQKMDLWTQVYPIDIFSVGRIGSTSPSSYNGIGVYWEYTGGSAEGNLVLRAWDINAAAWVEVAYAFNAADWDDVPVDIGFGWTGARGADVGRNNFELRLLINGRTVATLVSQYIRLLLAPDAFIGGYTGAWSGTHNRRSFSGMFREMMIFGDPMSDQDFRNAWDDTPALDNPSFEVASVTNRPGDADAWTWTSEQQAGGFAGFNEYRTELIEWATSFENFDAGFHQPHQWAYEDDTARLAAVGFDADDVGGLAWQRDDDTIWRLDSYSSIAWSDVTLETNEAWLTAFSELLAALFNFGTPLFETTVEEFSIWDFSVEHGETPGTIIGPPWLDEYSFVSLADDTVNNATGGVIPLDIPVGFRGWHDQATGLMAYPLQVEEFGEVWKTDPLSTVAGPMWIAGNCINGRIYGRALTFPLAIVPDRKFLTIYVDYSEIIILELVPGEYSDMAALMAMLEAEWLNHFHAATGVGFTSWTRGDEEGIALGWNDSPTFFFAWFGMLGSREESKNNDARLDLGLSDLGPNSNKSKVIIPAAEVATLPPGVQTDENFFFDPWTMILFETVGDAKISTSFPLDEARIPVYFGVFDAVPDQTVIEMFTFPGWFGAGAAWVATFSGTAAMFDGGSVDMEEFEDTNWPDNIYP